MDKHMTRAQMMATAMLPESEWLAHALTCEGCRQAIGLLRRFPLAGRLPLPNPPEAWVTRVKDLATVAGIGAFSRKLVARLCFDSWTLPCPAGVRGTLAASERRLYFEADSVTVDLRVEHRGNTWLSVAQLSGGEGHEISLVIDGKTVTPQAAGMIRAVGPRPPKRFALLVDNQTVELPEVSWRKRRTS